MPSPQLRDPLYGAAPALQPTARPINVQPGATRPAPSPLLQIGEAFATWQPELRNMLRDSAARADQDALALGELQAQKDFSQQKMGQVEARIKEHIDSGDLPAVRGPAFQRGYQMRIGKEVAQSALQEDLLQQLPKAIALQNDDPSLPNGHSARVEKIIADTYAKHSQQVGDDLDARSAFDHTAQGVIAGFRQRAAEGYTAAFKDAGEQAMADEGTEIVYQLASAPEDQANANRAAVRANLDELRKELPVSEVNQFYMQRVIAPAVDQLVASSKVTEARHLIDEMERLDVTGKGGILGSTSAGKIIFSQLRDKVEREARSADREAFEKINAARGLSQQAGDLAASTLLNQLRLSNDGQLRPEDRFKIIDQYRKENANDPLKVDSFAKAVHSEYENEEKFRNNDKAVGELELGIRTLNKEDLDNAAAQLDVLYASGQVSPSKRVQLSQQIDKMRSLYGAIDEQDMNRFKVDTYSAPTGISGIKTVNFGDVNATGPMTSSSLWDKLPEDLKVQHEQETTKFFYDSLQEQIRAIGDPNKVQAEKAMALDKATIKTREFARQRLRDLSTVKVKQENAKEVSTQTKQIQSRALVYNLTKDFTYNTDDGVPGEKAATVTTKQIVPVEYKLPKAQASYLATDFGKPRAEQNLVLLQLPGYTMAKWVALPELAADADKNEVPAARVKAKEVYALAKSVLGFTPEEIKAGKTQHGVTFNPAEIDPKVISVFRNVAELNKHWNNGELDDTFTQLGDLLDPNDTMTARQFYLAQRALLKK